MGLGRRLSRSEERVMSPAEPALTGTGVQHALKGLEIDQIVGQALASLGLGSPRLPRASPTVPLVSHVSLSLTREMAWFKGIS